jgi:uncharacterized protein YuzB (UPF0349 family)
MKIEAGVPQGSVLCPILFLIYINDISEGSFCPTNIFADDASLMECNESLLVSVEIVSNDLARIERWAAKWLITFNLVKTVSMIFSNKNNPPLVPQIMFYGRFIQQVDSHCHLGMTFTKNLNWNQHVDNVLRKTNQRLYFPLARHSMILSVIDYGCQVYCGLTAADVNRLEQLHYRAGIIITGSIKNSSYAKIVTELGWTTLSERRNYVQACLM